MRRTRPELPPQGSPWRRGRGWLLFLAFALPATAAPAATVPAQTTAAAGERAAAAQAGARASAELVSLLERAANPDQDEGPDLSLEAAERRAREARRWLRRLDRLDLTGLTHDEQLSAAVLRWDAEAIVDAVELYWYDSPLLPAGSPWRGVLGEAAAAPLRDGADVDAYLAFLDGVAATIPQVLRKARGRAARGIVLPDEQIDRVVPFLSTLMPDADANPLRPDDSRMAELDAEARARLTRGTEERLGAMEEDLARLHQYADTVLRERAPPTVGMGQYPGGSRAYRIATRLYTTLDVTPEEVHAIGVAAVADLEAQMAAVRERLGFTGTRAEFHDRLRADPRFFVATPEEFGARLMEYDARIRPLVDRWFLRQPEAPYDVRRVSPSLEGSLTYGFYNGPTEADPHGYYNYNGSRLDQRSLLSGAALTYHELVPGHHFQINLARENEGLHEYRRSRYYSGYGEGWGEYSSSVVAREMGLYDDPYDLYGRLVFDMFFAVRLVVDTGMNHYGWSRPKAMLYMREHTLESDVQIDSETIRYSMRSPAQALAYGMGRDAWTRLRRRAEAALGEAFDVRRFHDAVLSTGSLPLVVLEEHVDWWVAQERATAGVSR